MCPPCQPNTGRVPQPLAFWLAWEEDLAGIVVAPAGTIWVAAGTTVRRADGEAIVYTVAGEPGTPGCSGDGGPAADALLSEVGGLALDAGGNLFVADSGNASVRRIDALTGTITTVAGTPC